MKPRCEKQQPRRFSLAPSMGTLAVKAERSCCCTKCCRGTLQHCHAHVHCRMSQQHKHQHASLWCTAAHNIYGAELLRQKNCLNFGEGGNWDIHEEKEVGKHAPIMRLKAKVQNSGCVPAQASQLSFRVQCIQCNSPGSAACCCSRVFCKPAKHSVQLRVHTLCQLQSTSAGCAQNATVTDQKTLPQQQQMATVRYIAHSMMQSAMAAVQQN
jgi:hypothetical protein